MSPTAARDLFTHGMNPLQRKLHAPLIDQVHLDFERWRTARAQAYKTEARQARRRFSNKREMFADDFDDDRRHMESRVARELIEFLIVSIDQELESLTQLDRQHDEFRHSIAIVPSAAEKQRLVLKFVGEMQDGGRPGRRDHEALQRWFGDDAATQRFLHRRGIKFQRLCFFLRRLGQVAAQTLLRSTRESLPGTWGRLQLERVLQQVFQYRGDARLHTAALAGFHQAISSLPREDIPALVSDRVQTMMQRWALDSTLNVWIQREALAALRLIMPVSFHKVLCWRLEEPAEGDDLFLRRRAVELLGQELLDAPELVDLFRLVARDPNPSVRQQMAKAIYRAPSDALRYWLRHLALEDGEPQVRAAVLAAGLQQVDRSTQLPFLQTIRDVFKSEQDAFVLRAALHVAWNSIDNWCGLPGNALLAHSGESEDLVLTFIRKQLMPAVRQLQVTAEQVEVRRWAAAAYEQIWVAVNPTARHLRDRLREKLPRIPCGSSRRLPRHWLNNLSEDTLGRILSVLAQDDFGLDVHRRWYGTFLTRGPVFRFRWWRLLHELFHPSTEKRQAFSHTVGRSSTADLRAPSARLGELSETKVPGEPLHQTDEGSWRPFLPLVDDCLSALQGPILRRRPVRLVSAQGWTELTAPWNPLRRAWAWLQLTLRFGHYAALRNWHQSTTTSPEQFLHALQRLGFQISFRAHDAPARPARPDEPKWHDPTVTQFFPAVLGVVSLPWLRPLQRFFAKYTSYFFSVFENSLFQLVLFAAAILTFFLGKHLWANATLRKARRRIPLSIGGWGTRGKSGTERLKAALFSAQGFGVVSKSSGCEAMFLQAHAFQDLVELPLYRPYDKATIWEHRNMLMLSASLQPEVFLWECMGLTPAYVDVLQRQWSQDDLATITNAYPDHEDLQGPAGHNVAETIAGFVPRQGVMLTSEHNMLPYITDQCRRRKTRLKVVTWLESGLLCDDVLDRFPYLEHPDNIALTLALAKELGWEHDFALKEMADRLVPDLGVLKSYPVTEVAARRLEFTNGMSANERFGCLSNWRRLGFDQDQPAGVWITTVVNNRADRVARSRVFAQMLVNDLSANCHVLIGNNLKGLLGYIDEAWNEFQPDLALARSTSKDAPPDAAGRVARLQQWARRFRQPTSQDELIQQLRISLRAILPGEDDTSSSFVDGCLTSWQDRSQWRDQLAARGVAGERIDELLAHAQRLHDGWDEYQQLLDTLSSDSATAKARDLDREFQRVARRWFDRKLIVIDDYHATGEHIIQVLAKHTPPGFLNRVMGIQNIKGTGLDFIYRWVAWERCEAACRMLEDRDEGRVQQGLQELANFQDFGQLTVQRIGAALANVRQNSAAQRENILAQTDAIETRQVQALAEIRSALDRSGGGKSGILDRAIGTIEEFLDVNDAVHRRKLADQVYRDLANEHISRERAILELRAINQRQKGGWLKRWWQSRTDFRLATMTSAAGPSADPAAENERAVVEQSPLANNNPR